MSVRNSLLLILLLGVNAYGDAAGYSGKHEVSASNGTLTAHHVHNWDSPKTRTMILDFTHHEKFFSDANDFSYVELRDSNRKLLFRSPTPAFTTLWISPDSQFLIGISRIKLDNPYQLVVWKRDGTLLHREHISSQVAKLSPEQRKEFADRFPKAEQALTARYFKYTEATYVDFRDGLNTIGREAWGYLYSRMVRHPYSDDFSESVTNWVNWFDVEAPGVAIVRNGDDWVLSLRSPKGKPVLIQLKK